MDWTDGVSHTDLLNRVNRIAALLLPAENGRDSRVSRVFSSRSFRHYQTFGCIDAPKRDGQRVVYGFRHFVQALVVRTLLWQRVPAEAIATLLAGRSTEETKRILLEGVEFVARKSVGGGVGNGGVVSERAGAAPELWKRIAIAPGVELHLLDGLPKPSQNETEDLLAQLEQALLGRPGR